MSEELALSLLEELINSQKNLVTEVKDLTAQIEISDSVELQNPTPQYTGH